MSFWSLKPAMQQSWRMACLLHCPAHCANLPCSFPARARVPPHLGSAGRVPTSSLSPHSSLLPGKTSQYLKPGFRFELAWFSLTCQSPSGPASLRQPGGDRSSVVCVCLLSNLFLFRGCSFSFYIFGDTHTHIFFLLKCGSLQTQSVQNKMYNLSPSKHLWNNHPR